MTKDSVWKYASVDDIYKYAGWLLAAKLAEWLGMKVGIVRSDPPDRVAVIINLPSGQIHRVLPYEIMEGNWNEAPEDMFEDRGWDAENKAILDCLNGVLIHKSVLIIPEEKEKETE